MDRVINFRRAHRLVSRFVDLTVPPIVQRIERNRFRLNEISILYHTDVVGNDAELFAFLFRLELIRIAKATTVNELTALLPSRIVIPGWIITFARTADFR